MLNHLIRNTDCMMKNRVVGLLSAVVLSAMFSVRVGAFVVGGINYEVLNDTSVAVISLLEGHYEGHVVIPEHIRHGGTTYTVTTIKSLAFCECTEMLSIQFPATLTSIGGYTFEQCTGLRKLVFPDALETIGGYAFNECACLEEVHFGRGLKTLGNESFSNCLSLRAAVLPDGLKSVGHYAFAGCRSLQEAILPPSVIALGRYAFYGCPRLARVVLPASLHRFQEGTFQGCTTLQAVQVPYRRPLEVISNTFDAARVTIHVPSGCREAYEKAPVWKDFRVLEE